MKSRAEAHELFKDGNWRFTETRYSKAFAKLVHLNPDDLKEVNELNSHYESQSGSGLAWIRPCEFGSIAISRSRKRVSIGNGSRLHMGAMSCPTINHL
jgi:hypothetical protein